MGLAAHDVSRQQAALLAVQHQLLESLADEASVEVVLEAMLHALKAELPQTQCAMLLVDTDGARLHPAAAIGVPAGYRDALNGIDVGPNHGSCGTAVYRRRPVIVRDVATDPLWQARRSMALTHRIKACWSTPILGTDGQALGSFAVYARTPSSPTPGEHLIMERMARLAKIAIEHSRTQKALRDSEARLRLTIEAALDAVVVIDQNDRIQAWNRQAEELFGWPSAEALGQRLIHTIIPERHHEGHLRGMARFRATGEGSILGRRIEIEARRRNGTEFPVELTVLPLRMEGRTLFTAFLRDISKRLEHEAALKRSEARYRALYDEHPAMFFTFSPAGTILSANQYALQQLGWPAEELTGAPSARLYHSSSREQAAAHLAICQTTQQVQRADLQMTAHDGHSVWVRQISRIVKDADGNRQILSVCEDLSETYRLSQALAFQSSHDALTGLLNRTGLQEGIERALASARNEKVQHALLYMDLDQYRLIKEACGPAAGDELLCQMGALLQTHLQGNDTLARIGHDEFIALLEYCPETQAGRIAENLHATLNGFKFHWQESRYGISASIGLVILDAGYADAPAVLKAGEAACFSAKQRGRNRVNLYSEQDTLLLQQTEEMQWAARLHQGLEKDSFRLYFQPYAALNSDALADRHCELLLRMIDHRGEIFNPGAFLPAAEHYNLSVAIDRWVFRRILAWLENESGGTKNAFDIYAINLSGLTLGDETFHRLAIEHLRETPVLARRLCFEITETAAISNLEQAIRFIDALQAFGCRFALDDFGSGLSSFGYLKQLPVDFLKIDGAFVRGMLTDPTDLALVASINDIGHVMGKRTIAECVEHEALLDQLRTIGVDYAQGYAVAPPEPLPEA